MLLLLACSAPPESTPVAPDAVWQQARSIESQGPVVLDQPYVSSNWWQSPNGYQVAQAEAISDAALFAFETEGGCIAVEVRYTAGSNRSNGVTVLGRSRDGAEVGRAVVDMTEGGGWTSLGQWTFPAGENAIAVSRWAPAGVVIADAVRLATCGAKVPDSTTEGSAESGTESGTETTTRSVPYYSQYDNAYEPSATCGITSAAMLLGSLGDGDRPDTFYVRYGKAQGQSPEGLAQLYAWEGYSSTSGRNATRAQLKDMLDDGLPVVVHGFWTGAGHITVLVDYDSTGWIVNDPAGDWYDGYGYTSGKQVHYPYGGAWDQKLSWDGDIWWSTAW